MSDDSNVLCEERKNNPTVPLLGFSAIDLLHKSPQRQGMTFRVEDLCKRSIAVFGVVTRQTPSGVFEQALAPVEPGRDLIGLALRARRRRVGGEIARGGGQNVCA